MAEKRYSKSDQEKIKQDQMAILRARGVDAQGFHNLTTRPDTEVLKEMISNIGFTRDQSQSQSRHRGS